MSVQKTFTGTCPEYGEKAIITAEYAEVRTLTNPMTQYTYLGHKCSICSFKGCPQKECPLVLKTR